MSLNTHTTSKNMITGNDNLMWQAYKSKNQCTEILLMEESVKYLHSDTISKI